MGSARRAIPPDRDDRPQALFPPGEAACPPDAASPDLTRGTGAPGRRTPRTATGRSAVRQAADACGPGEGRANSRRAVSGPSGPRAARGTPPPHTRGLRDGLPLGLHAVGTTPACAGTTPAGSSAHAREGDHPRVRGEHARRRPAAVIRTGPPPRERGPPSCPGGLGGGKAVFAYFLRNRHISPSVAKWSGVVRLMLILSAAGPIWAWLRRVGCGSALCGAGPGDAAFLPCPTGSRGAGVRRA